MPIGAELLRNLKQDRRLTIQGVEGPVRALLALELLAEGKLPVLVAQDQNDAEALYRDLAFLFGTTEDRAQGHGLLLLAADEKNAYEAYSPDPRTVMERIATLYRLSRERANVRALVVTPQAIANRQIPPTLFDSAFEYLIPGETLNRDALLESLVSWGYNSVAVVEDPGTFSVRGGIIDIFSPYHPAPIRIDLFGDEIESLRTFEPQTQRTKAELDEAFILPAREIIFDSKVVSRALGRVDEILETLTVPSRRVQAVRDDIRNQIHFFGIETLLPIFHERLADTRSYLPTGDEVVYLLPETETLESRWIDVLADAEAGYANVHHELAVPPSEHVADGNEIKEAIVDSAYSVEFATMALSGGSKTYDLPTESTSDLRAEVIRSARDQDADVLEPVTTRLKTWRKQGLRTLIVCHTRGQAERLRGLLMPKGVDVRLSKDPVGYQKLVSSSDAFADSSVHAHLVLGEISGGFVVPKAKLAVLAEEQIFGQRSRRRRSRKAAAGDFVTDLAELKAGDFVVHIDFGVGLYHGMKRLTVNGVDGDFLDIEYKGRDKLYLPVHRLRLVQKYASAEEGKRAQLSKLGTTTWLSTKKKVKDSLLKMAAELLRLYAMRETVEGFALPPPTDTYRQFEAEFAFDPTPDQHKAIEDVVSDLSRGRPMDRLVCGDVGYGKTEVAMRAAMLIVQAKKQVAVLVPTTVLAAQHYNVFSERFRNHPVKIGIVSRFQTREQVKQTLREARAGSLDILIGTHRILGKDVEFDDLGLMVVDEEQRFGVAHKERLKKYRAQMHVLTLSATPIPRTMNMGLMGVRDLSMIATPPVDRLAVKTEVHKFSEEVIRDAVLKEIRRGGQCFVVHNRVASIFSFKKLLQKLVPEARVAVGHGQMVEEELEKVMVKFMNKEYNVLLSTTIIESGIDIPSANTIIINRADRMGLAQLYQLRGRVGRSRARGFCHYLIPAGNMSKDARKRIGVLQRFTELGAGFKVARHDLEIRGSGNILGKQQSGAITQLGFEMYQTLLNEAIDELKGAHTKHLREPEIQVPIAALLPDAYIKEPGERLAYYQRLNRAETDETTYDLLQELTDMYGAPPAEVENLCQLMLVKQRLSRVGATNLDYGPETQKMPPRVVFKFDEQQPLLRPKVVVDFVQRQPRTRKLIPDGRMMIHLTPFDDIREVLGQTKSLLDELQLDKHG